MTETKICVPMWLLRQRFAFWCDGWDKDLHFDVVAETKICILMRWLRQRFALWCGGRDKDLRCDVVADKSLSFFFCQEMLLQDAAHWKTEDGSVIIGFWNQVTELDFSCNSFSEIHDSIVSFSMVHKHQFCEFFWVSFAIMSFSELHLVLWVFLSFISVL